MASRLATRLKRLIIGVHRWLGTIACIAFLFWFPSGIAMMYWPYPSVTAEDHVEHLPALDAAKVALSPADAYATLKRSDPPSQVRLTSFNGRPVYRFGGGSDDAVYADVGGPLERVDPEIARRIAASWVRQPIDAAAVQSVQDLDQWTLLTGVEDLKPLWKYSWPNGEHVYVSEVTGDVVQYTTTASRIGAYFGPITHWLYFTPIRRHVHEWNRIIVWSSEIGTVAALLGIVVGLWVYSPARRRYRRDGQPSSIPYRGPRRWHLIVGLVFGVGAVTWTFSGLLTMDPFPRSWTTFEVASDHETGGDVQGAMSWDLEFEAFTAKHPRLALAQLVGLEVKELELATFDGESFYLASLPGGETRIVPVQGEPRREFDRARLAELVRQATSYVRGDIQVLQQYDAYYLDRRGHRPLPVIRAHFDDARDTHIYIDPRTATIVGKYDSQDWFARWIYCGLHSLDFPWLYNHRPAWDIVVITFMVGGMALSLTSLILAWRVLTRRIAAALAVFASEAAEPTAGF